MESVFPLSLCMCSLSLSRFVTVFLIYCLILSVEKLTFDIVGMSFTIHFYVVHLILLNESIKAFILYAESFKLHNSYLVAYPQRVPGGVRRYKYKSDSGRLWGRIANASRHRAGQASVPLATEILAGWAILSQMLRLCQVIQTTCTVALPNSCLNYSPCTGQDSIWVSWARYLTFPYAHLASLLCTCRYCNLHTWMPLVLGLGAG